MRSWLWAMIGCGAVVAGSALFARQVNTAAAPTNDVQLLQARRNVELVTADARRRTDFQSARRAVWALLAYTELRRGVVGAERQATHTELTKAWTEMELRAEREGKQVEADEMRPRY